MANKKPTKKNTGMTEQHVEEALSRAHVLAISAAAGCTISKAEYDYGIDGILKKIVRSKRDKLIESPFQLDYQLKATINHERQNGQIIYDLEADAWNTIVERNAAGAAPTILILCCLPKDRSQWCAPSHHVLELKEACYWEYLTGDYTKSKATTRIKISEAQHFTVETLKSMMDLVISGKPPKGGSNVN